MVWPLRLECQIKTIERIDNASRLDMSSFTPAGFGFRLESRSHARTLLNDQTDGAYLLWNSARSNSIKFDRVTSCRSSSKCLWCRWTERTVCSTSTDTQAEESCRRESNKQHQA